MTSYWKGKQLSTKHRENTSKTLKQYYKTHDGYWKGRKIPPRTYTHRMNLSKALMGHPVSEETRHKISLWFQRHPDRYYLSHTSIAQKSIQQQPKDEKEIVVDQE